MTTPLERAEESAEAPKQANGIGNGVDKRNSTALSRDTVRALQSAATPNGGPPTPFHDEENAETKRRSSSSTQSATNNQSDMLQLREGQHPKSNRQRDMGHYPPRESRQESQSPPTGFINTNGNSQLSEGWNEISNQFEESVGRPSREALHKFFYPPGNALSSPHHHNSPSRRLSKAHLSPRDHEKIKDKVLRISDKDVADIKCPPLHQTDQQQESQVNNTPPAISHRTMSGDSHSSDASLSSPAGDWPQQSCPVSPSFQHSFDAEEQQDRKYVEAFWRTYDDVIMLSLFTQLGVVARLATSTWLSIFDGGVFRSDSPLFTNLPLNCLSCFLLGLLASGDRLMEIVTTRFTPRNLQQGLVQEYSTGEDGSDHDDEGGPKGGLRNRKRRPKRAKKEPFHSWEPPLHWRDDLREVQLLALERRIRASKCLVLFPVMKEDADVMEHYFCEGYKASADQEQQRRQRQQELQQEQGRNKSKRHRRRFGRQRYCATNLADMEQDAQNSGSWDDFCAGDDEVDVSAGNVEQQQQYEDDGRFRFDLELTESTRKPSLRAAPDTVDENQAVNSENVSNLCEAAPVPPSVHKLIKRPPGQTTATTSSSPAAALEMPPQTSPPTQNTAVSATSSPPGQARVSQGQSPVAGAHKHQSDYPAENFTAGRAEASARHQNGSSGGSLGTVSEGEIEDPHLEHIISNVQANVSENISRIRRVNVADGWDVGTTPDDMADDLMLGLRDGFCGALSSFSSWNSSMLNLLREGHIGEAVVGYMLGIQLPIVAYRFGQQVAVYFFVWRCRREARRDEMKGWYGIRVRMDDDDDNCDEESPGTRRNGSVASASDDDCFEDERSPARSVETEGEENESSHEIPSVRAICTALYLLALVTQCTSLSFFSDPQDQQIALSLLFSPVGTLTRWRLSRFNCWRPGFPLGTFACNIFACALGGSFGSLLAGNPGPRERILLQSVIAGFGGTLSSLATFIVEILAGMDPLLFRFDGIIYAACSIAWALIVGFVFSASVDWADETT